MDDFQAKIAVVTGAGSGMGRELALQLASAGAHVALCDVFEDTLEAAQAACEAAAPAGTRVSAHLCDVASEPRVLAFRDAVAARHTSGHIDLLINNAGIAGGGSFIKDSRTDWERTFNVCWNGVYYCTRAFLPLLLAGRDGCLVNISSVNGFVAGSPTGNPHTAYSAAKFAVKGFTEGLKVDLRVHAPHVRVALVMPGHVGTSIVHNTWRSEGRPPPDDMSEADLVSARRELKKRNIPHEGLDDTALRALLRTLLDEFQRSAPLSARDAAARILEGVRQRRWRILIGDDAHALDQLVREHPEQVYDPGFVAKLLGSQKS